MNNIHTGYTHKRDEPKTHPPQKRNWYEQNIEKPVRDVVKLLRDNGFNTICSCGHKKYIQCSYYEDGELKRLKDLLFNQGYRNFTISLEVQIIDGFTYPSLEITFNEALDKE